MLLRLLLAAAAAVSSGDSAAADEPPHLLTLDWSAPGDCPTAGRVLDDIGRLVGGPGNYTRDVVAHVRVTANESGRWRVALRTETEGASRHRDFEAESCEAATLGATFILALALNPAVAAAAAPPPAPSADNGKAPITPTPAPPTATEAAAQAQPQPSTDSPPATNAPAAARTVPPPRTFERAPVAAPTPREPPPAEPAPRPVDRTTAGASRSKTRFPPLTLGAAFALDTGTAPKLAVGGTATVGLAPGPFRVELQGAYWGPQTGASGGAAATFSIVTGRARFGYVLREGAFTFGPLIGVGIESISADGHGGTAGNYSVTKPLVDVSWGGFAAVRVGGQLSFRLDVESLLPVFRPAFIVQEPAPQAASTIYQVAPTMARATLGGELEF